MVAEHLGAAPRSAKPRATGVLARLCFAAVAKAATSVDTLTAFLRDLRARYPERNGAISSAPQSGGRS